jgi:hypothetical protein
MANFNTTTHPIVQAILDVNQSPEDVAVLVGYFGPSSKPDYVRLYLSLDLHSYCELYNPAGGGDILNTLPSNPNNPNDPTLVFVKANADVKFVKTSSTGVQASFLQGAIATANLGATAKSFSGEGFIGDKVVKEKCVVFFSTRPHCP